MICVKQAIVYAAGAQLIASAGRSTYPSFLVGALVGLAFQCNFLGCRRLKVQDLSQETDGRFSNG